MPCAYSADVSTASILPGIHSWIKNHTRPIGVASPKQPQRPGAGPPRRPQLRWPPWKWGEDRKAQDRVIKEARRMRRQQIDELCRAVKAESVADLQEILCSMILAECVYKIPAGDMLQYINKFKSYFGDEIVPLERVQPSLDHVPHRYLLAEAGDTIYASFIGTKRYKDVITDVNILQASIFHEDNDQDYNCFGVESNKVEMQGSDDEYLQTLLRATRKRRKNLEPAAHRGFLARAKGIPAVELYKLAVKKKRKLVLCGHSLGGAVAVLSTLAILREIAPASANKEQEKILVKCITFSQPPVGNAALRDYVCQKGWQRYFKTYCIPEDLVPRILSPAYFDHYNAQILNPCSTEPNANVSFVELKDDEKAVSKKPKRNEGDRLVLGLGSVQAPFWFAKLVPLYPVYKHINIFERVVGSVESSSSADCGPQSAINKSDEALQSLEVQEGSEGISLSPIMNTDIGKTEANDSQIEGKNNFGLRASRRRRVPYLPSYVPFGQLYLLRNSSVELLSEAEYSKLTSVRSIISEIRELFQSHSMKSYRSRFEKIYDICTLSTYSFLGIDHLPHLPYLQKLLGMSNDGTVELGHIVDPPVIQTATSIYPLDWNGVPGEKSSETIKVDIWGYGMHLCTHVRAQVNGIWCSASLESIPLAPEFTEDNIMEPKLQKLKISIGPQLKQLPKHPVVEELSSTECISHPKVKSSSEEEILDSYNLDGLSIYCSSDFTTICKEVHVRARRVRLLGCKGSGKTSLYRAYLSQKRRRNRKKTGQMNCNMDIQKGVTTGLSFLDPSGVNLQKLHTELSNFREELKLGAHDVNMKTDLVVLVHNLAHKIPWYNDSRTSQPALSLFLNEVKAHGIPWILVITNKFSVSAHQRKALISYVAEVYQASPDMIEVVNSCPFVVPTASMVIQSSCSANKNLSRKEAAQRLLFSPINLARMSFRHKDAVLPVEGIASFNQLVHRVLACHEETAFEELANQSLSLELAREQSVVGMKQKLRGKVNSIAVAAVGASFGAGVGLVMTVVSVFASALRKP